MHPVDGGRADAEEEQTAIDELQYARQMALLVHAVYRGGAKTARWQA